MPEALDRCVADIIADPDFTPQAGRTKEEAAFAVCRSALGLAKDGSEDTAAIEIIRKTTKKAGRDKSKMMVLFDSRIDIDISGAEELDDGSARLDVRLAPEGEHYKNGPEEFDVKEENIEQAIANFKDRGAPVPVTIGHFDDESRQYQPAAGWIESLYRKVIDTKPYLMAAVRFLKNTWTAIKNDEFKFLSMEFFPQDSNIKGVDIGMNVDGLAILNYAAFPLRFDQSRSRGGRLFTLARFRAGDRRMSGDKVTKLQDGKEIRQVGEEFCIFNAAGEKLGCHPTMEAAQAAAADMTAKLAEHGSIKQVGEEFCIFNDAGEKGECFATREAAEAALKPAAPPAPSTESVDKGELRRLRKRDAELTHMESKQGSEVTRLNKRVKELEDKDSAKDRVIKASKIRTAITTLTERHNVHVPLGDFDIETDDGAIKFLASMPFGVESVQGLEKLAKDSGATAHLPRVNLGSESGSGGKTGDTGKADVTTKEGRVEAVRHRITALRKEFPGDEFDEVLRQRRETPEEFARMELSIEHPKVKWDED